MNKRINFGFSIILLSFVMLCITTFATLTLMTAHSDLKLSQKVAEQTSARYTCEAEAYLALSALDQELLQFYEVSSDNDSYLAFCQEATIDGWSYEDGLFQYHSATHKGKYLAVTAKPIRPHAATDNFYKITAWQMVTVIDDTDYSQTLHLITEEH